MYKYCRGAIRKLAVFVKLRCSCFEYDALSDDDDDDFPNSWFPFLLELRLPTAAQKAARLASTMACHMRPLSILPIWSQVLSSWLY